MGIYFGGAALLAFFVFPITRLQSSFDVDGSALGKILATVLRGPTPDHDPVPLSFLDFFTAAFVRPVLACREAKIRYWLTVLGVAEFGVAPEVANENDLVDTCHLGGISLGALRLRDSGEASPRDAESQG